MAAEFLERMGARARERREELGLSRAEVARRMPGKVNENQVYRWEKGLHQPNPDTLEALAAVLKTDVGFLMAPEPDKAETPDPFKAELSQLDRLELDVAEIKHFVAEISSIAHGVNERQAEQVVREMEARQQLEALAQAIRRLQPPQQQ